MGIIDTLALGVFGTGSNWPDLTVAAIMGALGLSTARPVLQHAYDKLTTS